MKHLHHLLTAIFIITITYARFFPTLMQSPIQKWDEQTNISIVTNEKSMQHFPILYKGDQPFFEKPPLWYWATMAVNTSLTDGAHSARVISAMAGFFILLLTTFLAWRWWGYAAGLSTWLVLISTNHLFTINPHGAFSTHTFRSSDVDSMHILFLVISFACLTGTTKLASILAGLAAGLSVLSKSPLGLLPLFVATLLPPTKRTIPNIMLSWGVAATIILPWYIWMTTQFHIPFLSSHFGYHLAARIQIPLEGHNKPFWYYARILSARHFFLSWEWLVGSVFFITTQKYLNDRLLLFTLVMALSTFIVPTITSTKLAWYVLPFYPFAALLIGFATSRGVCHVLEASKDHAITRIR